MTKVMLGTVPLSRYQGLRDDLENKVAGPNGERWLKDLSYFLRKDSAWYKERRVRGDDVWVMGQVFEEGFFLDGESNYTETEFRWFGNHSFVHICSRVYWKEPRVLNSWSESTLPPWDAKTFVGFCTMLVSEHFKDSVALSDSGCASYTADGVPAGQTDTVAFRFQRYGHQAVTFQYGDVWSDQWIVPRALCKCMHEWTQNWQAQDRIKRLVT